MKLDYSDLTELHGRDAREYANWLVQGLKDYQTNKPFSQPFGQAWPAIGLHEDVSDDLAAVFDVLQSWEKTKFRSGVAQAFQKLNLKNERDIYIASRLLLLAGKIEATPILQWLGPTVLANDLLEESEDGQELRYLATDLAISLADSSHPSRVCLRDLLKYRNYEIEKVRPLFLALCRAEPSALPRHLSELGPQLIDLFEEDGDLEAAGAELFLDTANLVPIRTLARSVFGAGSYEDEIFEWWASIPERKTGDPGKDLPMASLSIALQKESEVDVLASVVESMTPFGGSGSVGRRSVGILGEVGLEEDA